jgi:hypothetical protein
MWSSLWLDESGTWWVTNGRFGEIVERARLLPESIPYAAVVWATRHVLGAGEVALRLPSLAAALLCVWAIHRLGRELFDRETGLLAAGLFVALPPIVQAAHEARRYAFVVLAVVVAAWMLARWARTGRGKDAAGYASAATAIVYLHYLFATVLPAHAAWLALVARRREARPRGAQVVGVIAAIAIFTVPAAVLIVELGRSGSLHAFREVAGMTEVVEAFLPARIVAPPLLCILVVLAVTRMAGTSRFVWRAGPEEKDALWLLTLWLVVPIALLAAAAWARGVGVFDRRYLMSVVPAQALLIARLIRGIESAGARRVVLSLYLAAMLVARGVSPAPVREDWRAAAAAVRAANRGRPVLLGGTFIESRTVALVRDPVHADYLRAPLDYYDAGGKARVLPLRADSADGGEADVYADELLRGGGFDAGFALVERTSRYPSWSEWLEPRARAKGLVMRRVWDGERLQAWVCEPASPRLSSRGGKRRETPFRAASTGRGRDGD